jgi:hypothetical protein
MTARRSSAFFKRCEDTMKALFAIALVACTTNHYDVTEHRPIATACTATAGDTNGPDECVSDADCGAAAACACADATSEGMYGRRNLCVPAGCHVDTDCGAAGFCSASFGDCGSFYGTVLYACHTSDDECGSDADCTNGSTPGYCEFNPEVSHWTCGYRFCAG